LLFSKSLGFQPPSHAAFSARQIRKARQHHATGKGDQEKSPALPARKRGFQVSGGQRLWAAARDVGVDLRLTCGSANPHEYGIRTTAIPLFTDSIDTFAP
jgi:hypothetical protein